MAIYAIKGDTDHPENMELVFDSLNHGEGRFGWSTIETADLRELRDRINRDGEDTLTRDEQKCWKKCWFLLELREGDYVVYINVPEWGQCTLAKVTGEYTWHFDEEDFNHRFPVDQESIRVFDRRDAMVPPALRTRLSLQGPWWTIYVEREFNELLASLLQGVAPAPATPETSLRYLSREIQPFLLEIAQGIQRANPNVDLETLLKRVFQNVPGVRTVKRTGGPADHGADLLVELEFGSIPGWVQTLVVQVKSYTGELADTTAIKDIERAFEYYENADMGLIVSTATSCSEEFQNELEGLRQRSKKPVALLYGADLAAFFLRFGGHLLR